jgi:hypothetical protein
METREEFVTSYWSCCIDRGDSNERDVQTGLADRFG